MTRQQEFDVREKAISENVIILTIVASFMAVFLYYVFKQEQDVTEVGFNAVSQAFATRLTAIRAQWFMEGQPAIIRLKENDILVELNEKGWVDFSPDPQNCQKVWYAVIESELMFLKQPVAAIAINYEGNSKLKSCRYQLPSKHYFDYQLSSGRVSEIQVIDKV